MHGYYLQVSLFVGLDIKKRLFVWKFPNIDCGVEFVKERFKGINLQKCKLSLECGRDYTVIDNAGSFFGSEPSALILSMDEKQNDNYCRTSHPSEPPVFFNKIEIPYFAQTLKVDEYLA
jgi:hypothetical protein